MPWPLQALRHGCAAGPGGEPRRRRTGGQTGRSGGLDGERTEQSQRNEQKKSTVHGVALSCASLMRAPPAAGCTATPRGWRGSRDASGGCARLGTRSVLSQATSPPRSRHTTAAGPWCRFRGPRGSRGEKPWTHRPCGPASRLRERGARALSKNCRARVSLHVTRPRWESESGPQVCARTLLVHLGRQQPLRMFRGRRAEALRTKFHGAGRCGEGLRAFAQRIVRGRGPGCAAPGSLTEHALACAVRSSQRPLQDV